VNRSGQMDFTCEVSVVALTLQVLHVQVCRRGTPERKEKTFQATVNKTATLYHVHFYQVKSIPKKAPKKIDDESTSKH
jgi:hypothetical protein